MRKRRTQEPLWGSKCLLRAGQGPACLRSVCGQGRSLTSHPDFDKHRLIAEPGKDTGQRPCVLQAVGSRRPISMVIIFPPLPTGGARGRGERPGGLVLPGEVPPQPGRWGCSDHLVSHLQTRTWRTREIEELTLSHTACVWQNRDSDLCSPVLRGPKRGVRASVSPPYSGGECSHSTLPSSCQDTGSETTRPETESAPPQV